MSKKFIYVNAGNDYEESIGAFETSDYIQGSAGVGDAYKPVKTTSTGALATSLMSADVVLVNGTRPFTAEQQGVSPVTDSGLTTKAYVDAQVITGGHVKEALLADEQTSDAQGIRAAEVVYFTANPQNNDTTVIKNGTTTETYTFKTSSTGAFLVLIGSTAAVTMANFAAAINASSVAWGGEFYLDALDSINAAGVVVVYELTTAAGTSASRIYGTWATAADIKVIEYNGTTEYSTAKAAITMPASDPGAGRFGIRRQVSALINGEIHLLIANDYLVEWDADAARWWTLSAGAVPEATSAPGGGIKGKWTADEYKGLRIVSGVGEVRVDASTINFISSGLNQGKLEVPANGITATQINTSAVGSGLTGGGGSAIAIDFAVSPWNTNKAVKDTDLSSTAANKGASIVGVEDTAGYYVGTNVETVLAEIGAKLALQGATYNAGPAGVTKGDLVYISSTNLVSKLPIIGAGSGNWGIGLAATTALAGANVQVTEKDGLVLAGVLTSATPGTRYFWTGAGFSTSSSTASGAYVWMVGVARNATDLAVDINFLKKNA